ncbi:MAG: hypothetical protein DSZ27_02570 [Thiomicrospira sp.]|nr:MAG: hypothetical protein DSZ27_02570 [Thiomicrospira sp.]
MNTTIQTALVKSASKILGPLVRIMLRNGVSCGSFEEMVRKAYVDEAFNLSMIENKKATVSSVSAKTGLSRKEVKRLNELEVINYSENDQKYNRATRVLGGWTNDKEFLSPLNNPVPLSIEDGEHSFIRLVKKYSGDITPKAMYQLLLDAKCIKKTGDVIHLINPAYVPGNDSPELISILGTDTQELIQTINHNLSSQQENKRFQRKVSSATLDKEALSQFEQLANQKSQALLEELDHWLSQHEAKHDKDSQYVSLGIYFYQKDSNGELP